MFEHPWAPLPGMHSMSQNKVPVTGEEQQKKP